MVVEDDEIIVAVGLLSTLLEATFVTDPKAEHRVRIAALKALVYNSDTEVHKLGYDSYHGYVADSLVKKTLMKSFHFVQVVGDNLIRWIR